MRLDEDYKKLQAEDDSLINLLGDARKKLVELQAENKNLKRLLSLPTLSREQREANLDYNLCELANKEDRSHLVDFEDEPIQTEYEQIRDYEKFMRGDEG